MKNKQLQYLFRNLLLPAVCCLFLQTLKAQELPPNNPKQEKKEAEKKIKEQKKAQEKKEKQQAEDKKDSTRTKTTSSAKSNTRVLYGLASYYSNKFHGRRTANGEIFSQDKMTAACNTLPLGTWIKVTNMRNGRSVIVKTNDRLHPRMKRIVDLTRAAATKLGYIKAGLTRVKIEVLGKKRPQ